MVSQEGVGQGRRDFGAQNRLALREENVRLGDRHYPQFDAQERSDLQMLPGLATKPLHCRYHQQDPPRPSGPADHGAEEVFVTRSVDQIETAANIVAPGKAQGDGEATVLLFFEPVSLHPGQGANQGGLAVIDVPDHRQGQRRVHRFDNSRSCGTCRPWIG